MTRVIRFAGALVMLAAGPLAAEDGHGDHSVHHANHVSLGVALTSNLNTHHTDYTLGGGEYERRLGGSAFGLAVVGELVLASHRETILAAGPVFHPVAGLKLMAAAGKIFVDGGESHFLTRVGIAYDFPVGRLTVTPGFNLDRFHGETALVYGIQLGWGF